MNPELQVTLSRLLEDVRQVGMAAWDKAPLVLEDVLTAGVIEHSILLSVGLGMGVFASWLLVWAVRWTEENEDVAIPCWLFGVGGMIGAVCLTVFNLIQLLMAIYAPRAYLLDKLGDMIK